MSLITHPSSSTVDESADVVEGHGYAPSKVNEQPVVDL